MVLVYTVTFVSTAHMLKTFNFWPCVIFWKPLFFPSPTPPNVALWDLYPSTQVLLPIDIFITICISINHRWVKPFCICPSAFALFNFVWYHLILSKWLWTAGLFSLEPSLCAYMYIYIYNYLFICCTFDLFPYLVTALRKSCSENKLTFIASH